ncbi:MAG: nucleoside deaminase [Methanospirillaceae archaeon]|nr:nucleoside deaminase [Methanospirillaceae archaeon]
MWDAADEILGDTKPRTTGKIDPFLAEAIREAELGRSEGGIPIGSVLVRGGQIIGHGHNRRVQQDNPMIHAEIDCLMNAGRMRSYRDCILYSTLMPCFLCAGAIVQFGIRRVVVGESRTFLGAREFLVSHGVRVTDHDDERCAGMMNAFISENPDLWNEDIGKDD